MKNDLVQQPSRVIMAVETRLLRQLLSRAIVRSPHLQVVATVDSSTNLASVVEQTDAEWVIISLLPDGQLPGRAWALLSAQPSVSVLAVMPDGSRVKMGWTEPYEKMVAVAADGSPVKLRWTEIHEMFLNDLSLDELITILRKGTLWELAIQDFSDAGNGERRLDGKKIAILITNGFEQVEFTEPKHALEQAGAQVCIVSPADDKVRGWNFTGWGDEFPVDVRLKDAKPDEYDGLLLPGGVLNCEALRINDAAVQFVKAFFQAGKPVAAICHSPWTMIEADAVKGRRLTSAEAIQSDLENAGAHWLDQPVVVDSGLVTSRKPDDIPIFERKMIEVFAGG